MDAPRLLLLAADPVAAWRARTGSGAEAAAPELVVLASDAARATFAVVGAATTLERWARRPPRFVAPPPARRRALVAAVAEVLGGGGGAGAAGAPPGAPFDAPGSAAIGGDAVRLLVRAAATAAVDLEGPPPPALDARAARWWRVAAAYRRRLRALGACDPAEARGLAAAEARAAGAPARRRLAVLGHATLAPDEVALIDALAAPGSVVLLPHDPPWTDAVARAAADLVARGWEVRHAEDADPPAARAAWAWPTLEDEARAAVAEVKRLRAAGVVADQVLLGARDPQRHAEALFAAAAEAGVDVRVERAVPLAATPDAAPLVAWLEAVARGGAFEPTLAWLAHPRVALVDADDVARVRRWRPSGAAAWARALARAATTDAPPDASPDAVAGAGPTGAASPEPADRVPADRVPADRAVAVRRALSWPSRTDAAGWRTFLEEARAGLAEAAFGRADGEAVPTATAVATTATAAPATDGADGPAAAAWATALAAVEALADDPDGGDPRLPRAAVLAALRDALRHALVRWTHPGAPPAAPGVDPEPAAGDPGDADAVWLRPLEAFADRRAAHVLLLGAVDGVLPTAVADDPVLGFRERATLAAAGLPVTGAGDAARLEALRFWGALRAATVRAWIGVPAQTGADARLPSPFLAAVGLAPAAPPALPPASPAAFRAVALRAPERVPDAIDPVLGRARRAHAQALARETGTAWGPDDGFVGLGVDPDARVWSATQLRDLGGCRFRWWVGHVLGVAAPEEGVEALTPLLEGRLAHGALDGALRAAVGLEGAAARAAADAALDAAFAAAEAAERLGDVVPHWARLRGEHLAHLRALLAAPDFLPDGHEVVATEARFEGVWHGWRVRGFVDRIDRTPLGVELIDYKLSGRPPAGARDAELAPTLDLQLPLYREVAAPLLRPGERVAGAAYVSLRTRARLAAQDPRPAEVADLLARLRASLEAGFFPPEPHPDVCRWCDFEAVCRKGPHLERRPLPYRVPEAEA